MKILPICRLPFTVSQLKPLMGIDDTSQTNSFNEVLNDLEAEIASLKELKTASYNLLDTQEALGLLLDLFSNADDRPIKSSAVYCLLSPFKIQLDNAIAVMNEQM